MSAQYKRMSLTNEKMNTVYVLLSRTLQRPCEKRTLVSSKYWNGIKCVWDGPRKWDSVTDLCKGKVIYDAVSIVLNLSTVCGEYLSIEGMNFVS